MLEAQLPLVTWPVPYTAEELMKRLENLPLAFHPGERWLYHMGAEILGVLIARVAGTSLGSFLRERIFEPLEMVDTDFFVPQSKLDRLPACYGIDFPMVDYAPSSSPCAPELVLLHEAHGGYFSQQPVFESGGGGLVSTVDDLLAFGKMMLNNGKYGSERILSRPSIELMTMDHITAEQKTGSPFFENFWETHGWGFGLSVVTRRDSIADVPGRFGWDGAFGTSFYMDPKEQLIGILLTQRRPDVLAIPAFIQDFWTSAYQMIND
jgi:CubicO group peptidase (beta-lactamase class C family)